jgi:menaquinone-dependent protoporphyrinogen IX oxidase
MSYTNLVISATILRSKYEDLVNSYLKTHSTTVSSPSLHPALRF